MTPTRDNAMRFDAEQAGDHVESWFWRANHPREPLAMWLKATILSPRDGEPVAEAWCCTFDGATGETWGQRETVPVSQASFGPVIRVGGCEWVLGDGAGTSTGGLGDRDWDLSWTPVDGPLGEPLCLLPTRRLVDAPFPKNKLLTPSPTLRFDGRMRWGDRVVPLSGWLGMQGHNWGAAHAHTYAWGQCVFTDGDGEPVAMAEGFSGRIKLGGWLTPYLSALTVRHGDRTYRFDRLVDLWNQTPSLDTDTWVLKMRGPAGEALLSMRSQREQIACLGYTNPDGHLSYCLNSKLAATTLRVNPVNEDPFECHSAHGGALEFLQRHPDPRFPQVV